MISHVRSCLEPGDFQDEKITRIVSLIFELAGQGKKICPSNLANYLNDEKSLECICEAALISEAPETNRELIINDCIRMIKNRKHLLERQRLHEEIKLAEIQKDEEKLEKLRREFCSLIKGAEKK